MKISNKKDFIKVLEEFTKINNKNNILSEFHDYKIIIDETENEGKGEIYLDISEYKQSNIFFIKISHLSTHTIGKNNTHNDGIVLKVDLDNKLVEVSLFELKKQLRFNKLEKAVKQLANAYRFISYMQLENCCEVKYHFFIVYEINNIIREYDNLKEIRGYQFELFNTIFQNKDKIPIQIPFCRYKEFDFQQLRFGEEIKI